MITTEHNGVEIKYSDNRDLWICPDLDLEAATLSALREKINKVQADARRVNVPVICLGYYGATIEFAGTATLIDRDGGVWVTRNKGKRRSKMSRDRVLADTPENRALIAEIETETKRLEALNKRELERLKLLAKPDFGSIPTEDKS